MITPIQLNKDLIIVSVIVYVYTLVANLATLAFYIRVYDDKRQLKSCQVNRGRLIDEQTFQIWLAQILLWQIDALANYIILILSMQENRNLFLSHCLLGFVTFIILFYNHKRL